MTQEEIQQNIREFASDNHVPEWKCRAIPKCELANGITYKGNCRNASEAIWDVDKFIYMRTKFGCTYPEEIKHFEDDDGYDVFVPIEVEKTEYTIMSNEEAFEKITKLLSENTMDPVCKPNLDELEHE